MPDFYWIIGAAFVMAGLPVFDALAVDWKRVWRDSWLKSDLMRFHGQWIFDFRWYWWDHHFFYTRMWWPRGLVWSAGSYR